MFKRPFDCVIIGGGPAGLMLASTLADWGRRVAVLDDGRVRADVGEELVAADAEPILKRHGLITSVRAHDFRGPIRQGLVWGDGRARWRTNTDEDRGFQIELGPFRDDMRSFARALGVRVVEDAHVPGPLPAEGRGTVKFVEGGRRRGRVAANCIVVATGAATGGELAPVALEHQLPPARLLVARVLGESAPDGDGVVVESVPEGCLQWLPLHRGGVALSLLADDGETVRRTPGTVLRAAASNASGPAAHVADDCEVALSVPATARLVTTPAPLLLVGDAASTVDRLVGKSLEKTLLEAEATAVAVNTIVERPGLRDLVLAHHRGATRSRYLQHAREALHLYLSETRFADFPFWAERHAAVRVEVDDDASPGLPDHLRVHRDVAERRGVERHGRVYEDVTGFARPEAHEVVAIVGRVPVGPLLRAVGLATYADSILDLAHLDPELAAHPRRALIEALTQLHDLGIIEAAPEGGGRP